VKKDDILEAMSTKAGGVLNLKVLADDLGKIRELYSKKGYYKTEVTYELEADRSPGGPAQYHHQGAEEALHQGSEDRGRQGDQRQAI